MAAIVVMPKQGNTVESCLLTKWFKREGDAITAGEPLFAYETDKSAFEEAAQAGGTLLKILRPEGDDVPVMEAICVIGGEGEDISELLRPVARPAEKEAASLSAIKDATQPRQAQAAASTEFGGENRISPRARHLAQSMGLDEREAQPTGPDGRVIERDIWMLADGYRRTQAQASPVSGFTDVPLSNIRKLIAEGMHRSISELAQLTHHSSADATAMLKLREKYKAAAAAGGPNVTLNDMLLFAVSRVLKRHPDMNAHFLGDRIRRFGAVNLGMAVDTERGLMVPTIFGADKMTLEEISAASRELAGKCRSGAISPDALAGGTFTVSNLGILGVELYTPIVNPPQTGILGVCAIMERPRRAAGGQIEFYPAVGLSLTYDHRAVDGAPASRFLQDLCSAVTNLGQLLN